MSDGYLTRTAQHDGHTYTFRFYQAFVSRLAFHPQGGPEIEVYNQGGEVYHIPQTPGQPRRGPDERSTLSVSGGPHDYDVEIEIDDSPQDPEKFTGPVRRVELGLQPRGRAYGAQHRNAKAVRGHEHVARITVHTDGGGVHAMQGGGGDGVVLDNNAVICPPFC